MKNLSFILCLCLCCQFVEAQAPRCSNGDDNVTESGSHSTSESGYLKIRRSNGSWERKYFYLYTYQYASIFRGEVQNENHNFNFNGFLDEGGTLNLVGKAYGESALIYENSNFWLKVPYDDGEVYFKQKSNGYVGRWQCLTCDNQQEIDTDEDVSESGSHSTSASGHLNIRNANGHPERKYYYLYTYQYAYIYRGVVKNENHNFNFNGFLDEGGTLQLVGKVESEPYLIYENSAYWLKVPYKRGDVYFRQKCSGHHAQWQRLD